MKADLLDLPNVEDRIVHLLQVVDPAQGITQEITSYQMPTQEINTFSAEMSTEGCKGRGVSSVGNIVCCSACLL